MISSRLSLFLSLSLGIIIQPSCSFQPVQCTSSCTHHHHHQHQTTTTTTTTTTAHTSTSNTRTCHSSGRHRHRHQHLPLAGWIQGQGTDGEWVWEEDDPTSAAAVATTTLTADDIATQATPSLPGGSFRPKQSLGQNFLRDGNTVAKIVKAFVNDATSTLKDTNTIDGDDGNDNANGNVDDDDEGNTALKQTDLRAVELGPGAGALTDVLVPALGVNNLQCIEIDDRAVELLGDKHPALRVTHQDVLQVDYPIIAQEEGGPLSIIGNLPYYITSQILFALADASHNDSIRSATVTMQYEVGERIVASTRTKAYGILSVVFQLYADCHIHFKIPPTVFYPAPKVDSALIGLHFLGPTKLRKRLGGVDPADLRRVVTSTFQQRRKTVRNGLKPLALSVFGGDKEKVQQFLNGEALPLPKCVQEAKEAGDEFAMNQELPSDWAKKRPEELTAGQFVEITRMLYGPFDGEGWETSPLRRKVWRKLKHGSN